MDENKSENIENDIYNVLIGKLPERYKVSRKTIYDRLRALKIKSVKKNQKLYITADDLQLMDDLYVHMEIGGGTLKDFVEQRIPSDEFLQGNQVSQEILTLLQEKMTPSQLQELTATDLQKISERAQKRAFTKAVLKETMDMIYRVTGEFPTSEIIEQVKQQGEAYRQAKEKQTAAHDKQFFSSELGDVPAKGTCNQQLGKLRTQKQPSIVNLKLRDPLLVTCLALTVVTVICIVFLPIYSVVIGAGVFLGAIATFPRSK